MFVQLVRNAAGARSTCSSPPVHVCVCVRVGPVILIRSLQHGMLAVGVGCQTLTVLLLNSVFSLLRAVPPSPLTAIQLQSCLLLNATLIYQDSLFRKRPEEPDTTGVCVCVR